MLLLYYHQLKEMKEGHHRSPFQPLSITEAQVADLLKVSNTHHISLAQLTIPHLVPMKYALETPFHHIIADKVEDGT